MGSRLRGNDGYMFDGNKRRTSPGDGKILGRRAPNTLHVDLLQRNLVENLSPGVTFRKTE